MSMSQPLEEGVTSQYEKDKAGINKPTQGELKVPDLQFASYGDSNINFQLQASKLLQANTILSELIKEAALEKYNLSQKIHNVLQQIKKLQSKVQAK